MFSASRMGALLTSKVFRRLVYPALAVMALWLLLFTFPGIILRHAHTAHGLTLRSDRPFDREAADRLLRDVRTRLEALPLDESPRNLSICITHAGWRRFLFCPRSTQFIGVTYPFSNHVFLRSASVEHNTVSSPRGGHVGAPFTLRHTILHELGHIYMYQRLGRFQALAKAPVWIQEGFAEYTAGIDGFDVDTDSQRFLREDPLMQPPQPGAPPYRRLHLLMTFLIEHEQWPLARVFQDMPSQASVEDLLRQRLGQTPNPPDRSR